ncbi:MAG: aconitase family protein [Firmicutes bacterium]|nr:aconitase family protein [Bacillota bacterium]
MNFVHQALAHAGKRKEVSPGERLEIAVDLALAHDGSAGQVLDAWEAGSYPGVFDGSRVIFTLDHLLPAPTVVARTLHLRMQEFARRNSVLIYHRGEGVLHQVVAEEHRPRPGMILAAADGHVATAGAFGALGFSVKPGDLAAIMATGRMVLEVPEVIAVEVTGRLQPGVMARDLALWLLDHFGATGLKGKVLALAGSAVWGLSEAGKMALCNMTGEMGAATGLIVPPESVGDPPVLKVEATKVAPLIACPGSPPVIRPAKELAGTLVTQVLVGGCSSGRLEDMEALMAALGGRLVHPRVNLLVVPASRAVANKMEEDGLARYLRKAGAVITSPGCGPCPGLHAGLLAVGERAVAATVRNTPGRMGSDQAEIFLASPRIAGLAACAGEIQV